jgi:hypothetical protein
MWVDCRNSAKPLMHHGPVASGATGVGALHLFHVVKLARDDPSMCPKPLLHQATQPQERAASTNLKT